MLSKWRCRPQGLAFSGFCFPTHRRRGFAHSTRLQIATASTGVDHVRNIGIIAHIDAGKTTTTERMLYYSGYTRRIGNVDEGSTVTDFLPAERARGITIQSAAITFQWPPQDAVANGMSWRPSQRGQCPSYTVNLIDTPGHADFTFEVLRSLRVLDGAVCILDGVAGVEAQTEQVWTQAAAYQIPRIIYVNKLDRDGATFASTVREIGARLSVWPAICCIPWWGAQGKLKGVGDVINGLSLRYVDGSDGKDITASKIEDLEKIDPQFASELNKARAALIELLSEHDEGIVEKYLESDTDSITGSDLMQSLRRCTLQWPQRVVPVFAGASFRNVGVQPLLDAVVQLLPSPHERPDSDISFGSSQSHGSLGEFLAGKLQQDHGAEGSSKRGKAIAKIKTSFAIQKLEACALAFKVVADPRRGVLVYVRVYSGAISRNAALWNTTLQQTERIQRLYRMYADDPVEVDAIEAGSIGVIPGLKLARTGDTLVSYAGANPKHGPPQPITSLHLRPIVVPPPVFFAAVEPNSLGEEKHIKECVDLLLREDPSLSVRIDPESGQTHLSGMGELHLEIAGNRLIQDLKAKARIGEIQIGYREALLAASDTLSGVWEHEIGGKVSKAGYSIHVQPAGVGTPMDCHVVDLGDNNRLLITTPKLMHDGEAKDDAPALPPSMPIQTIVEALKNGTLAALASGSVYGFPVHSADVILTFDQEKHLLTETTLQALSNMARAIVRRAVRGSSDAAGVHIMEPVMLATISVDDASLGDVVHDINSARGGSIISLDSNDEDLSGQTDVDISRIYAPPDPHGIGELHTNSTGAVGNGAKQIVARVPLKEMVGYLKHLRSLTGGRGTFTMTVDRFEAMSANRQKMLLSSLRGGF